MSLSSPTRCEKTGKVRYCTRKGAKQSIRQVANFRGRKVQVYRCDHCDGFHLSTMPRELHRKVMARKAGQSDDPDPA